MSFVCKKMDANAFPEFGKVLLKRGFQQEVATFIGILKSNLISPENFEDAIKNTQNLGIKTQKRC